MAVAAAGVAGAAENSPPRSAVERAPAPEAEEESKSAVVDVGISAATIEPSVPLLARQPAPRLLDLASLDLGPPESGVDARPRREGAGFSYDLGDSLRANLNYKHAFLFGTASNEALQNASFSGFSTSRERDIINLKMSWRLAWSTVDLGYRFESTRPEVRSGSGSASGGPNWLPGSQDMLHGLMVGFTQEFGGSP
jgi:hypothetical protein